MTERLRAYCMDSGALTGTAVTTEMFDAVRASEPVSPLDFAARLAALGQFLVLPDAVGLTAANKRISNILRKADAAGGAVDVTLLREPAERRCTKRWPRSSPTWSARSASASTPRHWRGSRRFVRRSTASSTASW
jgi:glycyl-tRNA synthetase beta chain